MGHRRLLCRRQAAEHLATQHRLDISGEQLARWAVRGGGPPFYLLAGRAGKAVYCSLALDAWAVDYLGPIITRVAEHPAHRSAAA